MFDAMAHEASFGLCWRLRKAGLFRLPAIYGALDRSAPVLVFDVGAGDGRSAEAALSGFPNATVHSFEPLPGFLDILRGKAHRHARWHIHPVALEAREGTVPLNFVVGHPEASSLLEMNQEAQDLWGRYELAEVQRINVRSTTLDGVWTDLKKPPIDILKIDVQGKELACLKAGTEALQSSQFVIVEVSLLLSYVGAVLYTELHDFSCGNWILSSCVSEPPAR